MYQRMLVPLDGSELAETVLPYAKELAGRLDLEVIVLCVCTPALQGFVPMHRAYAERTAERIQREAREVQQKTGLKASTRAVAARGEMADGYAAEEILRFADEEAVDLILMATHGRSGRKRWAMGSVSDKVLRSSKIPIWLVRADIEEETAYDQWPKTTLLVTLDGSELAESVLPHVETLAAQRGTKELEVALLRVCEPPAIPSYYAPELSEMPLNWGEYEQQEIAKCKQVAIDYLAVIEKRLKGKKISVHSEILVGKAADQIVDYAGKTPFSMIVMATHGRSGLSRWVYGSVAENILTGVPNPIFLVRPQ